MHTSDKAASPLSGANIIVSGAGIAGLAFVASLKAVWTPEMGQFPHIVHYERDKSHDDCAREGYSVSVRSGGHSRGMQALRALQLLDKVLAAGIVRGSDCEAHLGLWRSDWSHMRSIWRPAAPDLPRSPMRIPRAELRRILMTAAYGVEGIQWGTTCMSAHRNIDGSIHVQLSNGCVDTCDVLVVADGANSKIRDCLRPRDGLDYTGYVSITAVSRFDDDDPSPVDRNWGLITSGTGVSLFVSPMGNDTANWCLTYGAKSPQQESRQPLEMEDCKRLWHQAKSFGTLFKGPFDYLLDHSDLSTIMRFNNMDKAPFAHGPKHDLPAGVVFVGDSNHAVTAFAANGANLALNDGLDLAQSLCAYGSIEEGIAKYDKRSIPRARTTLRRSHKHIIAVHSTGLEWSIHRIWWLIDAALFTVTHSCKLLCNKIGV